MKKYLEYTILSALIVACLSAGLFLSPVRRALGQQPGLYAYAINPVTSLPGSCSPTVNNIVFLTTGVNPGIYACIAANTWSLVPLSGFGGGGANYPYFVGLYVGPSTANLIHIENDNVGLGVGASSMLIANRALSGDVALGTVGGNVIIGNLTGPVRYLQILNGGEIIFNALVAPNFPYTASPASGAACTAGDLTWDASYGYICTASGAWKRFGLTGGY